MTTKILRLQPVGKCIECKHLASVLQNGLPKCGHPTEPYLYSKVFASWFGCIRFEMKYD